MIKVHNRFICTLCLLVIAQIEIDHVTQIRFDQLGGNTLHFVTLNSVTTAILGLLFALLKTKLGLGSSYGRHVCLVPYFTL